MSSNQVKVAPNSERGNNESQKAFLEKTEKGSEKEKSTGTKVPPYHLAMIYMINGSWLNANDHQEKGCNQLFIAGNINISLICALLFTTFMPLYYNEAQRLNDEMDGLTLDIALGYLAPLVLTKTFIHDFFDICYLLSTAGTLFGTMVSVFFMLAANETADDRKTFVLIDHLGPHISQLPFYFFTIGIGSWAVGAMFHVFVVPRSAAGFYIKVVLLWAMIVLMIQFCFPRMILGVFRAKAEEEKHRPVSHSLETIKERLDSFLDSPPEDGDISLTAFLKSLTFLSEYKFRPPLNPVTEVHAKRSYYEKIGELTGCSKDEVKEYLDHNQ
jgi:uncharacterized membrane protein